MGKTIVISDLHLGDKRKRDDFWTSGQWQNFILFLALNIEKRQIEKGDIDKLIINGDLFELWQCNLAEIIQIYRHLFILWDRLSRNGIEIIYIPGNHDSVPFTAIVYDKNKKNTSFSFYGLKVTPKIDLLEVGNGFKLAFPYYTDGSIWIEHGHRFDEYNMKATQESVGKKTAKLIATFEDLIPDIDNILSEKILEPYYIAKQKVGNNKFLTILEFFKVASKENHPKKAYRQFSKKVIKFAKEKNVKVIITGHTHKEEIFKENGIVYVNTGSWVRKDYAVYCEYDKDEISLYKWIGKKSKLIDTVKLIF